MNKWLSTSARHSTRLTTFWWAQITSLRSSMRHRSIVRARRGPSLTTMRSHRRRCNLTKPPKHSRCNDKTLILATCPTTRTQSSPKSNSHRSCLADTTSNVTVNREHHLYLLTRVNGLSIEIMGSGSRSLIRARTTNQTQHRISQCQT